MQRTVLIEAQYLPPIAYFASFVGCDKVIVEKFEHYEKQTYRNRCYILGSHGTEVLILPLTSKHGKTLVKDVRIDHSQKWMQNHWRAIQTAYGKAPFFEYYSDDLNRVMLKKHEFLFDFNLELLTMCLKWLKWKLPIEVTLAYDVSVSENVIDLRSAITPKNAETIGQFYQPAVYRQVFGSKFVNNLSVLDLILCEGPAALTVVQASSRNEHLQDRLRF
jgi:hypothetical protein